MFMKRDVPQNEVMLFLLKTTVSLWLVWAVVGVAGYWVLAEYFGWNKLGIEANVSIFFGLTIAGLAAIAALVYLDYRLMKLLK